MEGEPIISKWHKSDEISDERIAEGFMSGEMGKGMGVRRKTFETDEGEKYYVYKEVLGIKDAHESMNIYLSFKKAGIPVVDFAKIVKKKSVDGKDEYIIAMHDLTENDKYKVKEVIELDESDIEVIDKNFKEDMVISLAKIHNMGFYDYHPALSYVVRYSETDNKISYVDFRVIDYANFEDKESAKRSGKDFETECKRDIDYLIESISNNIDEQSKLRMIYSNFREN